MRKSVNNTNYWKWRLDKSKLSNLFHSVYITNERDWQFIEREHLKILEPYRNKKVLDAGCGYGRASEWFEDYVGVDFSPDFIKKAKELYPDKDFRVENLKDLPFKDNEFDMAFCISVKGMIVSQLGQEEWEQMEEEIKRVAKEVVYLEYSSPKEHEIIKK